VVDQNGYKKGVYSELEFACEKEPLFEKWLTSNEITTHFDK
jgi:hypothetical protein